MEVSVMCAAANKGAKHAMTAVRVLHDMRHHGMPNETAWAAMRRMEFKTVDPVWTSEIAWRFFR